jgi:hypothetical protein
MSATWRIPFSVAVAIVVAATSVAILRAHDSARCISLGRQGNAVIRTCHPRPDWAIHSGVLLLVAGAATALALAFGLNMAAAAGGLVATAALTWGLGNLTVHLWAPPATAQNSSPPPEAAYFAGGAIVALLTSAAFTSAILLRDRAIRLHLAGRLTASSPAPSAACANPSSPTAASSPGRCQGLTQPRCPRR